MSTGLSVFDRTIQESNLWLKDVETRLACTRHQAYSALRAVLHALRDRLPPETALHFAGQLPMLLRGLCTEGWTLSGKPTRERTAEDFIAHIAEEIPPGLAFDGETIARAVFQTVRHQMDLGEVDKVMAHLPAPIRELWLEEYV